MTERVKGFLVHLEDDVREDDAEKVADAMKMFEGVVMVEPIPANHHDVINRNRVRKELTDALFDALGVGWMRGKT